MEKLEEKIEQLEGENAELRIDFVTAEKALKRLQLDVKHTMLLGRAKENGTRTMKTTRISRNETKRSSTTLKHDARADNSRVL